MLLKGSHLDIIKQILTEIKKGMKSYKPTSNSESDMEDFQSVAKILVYADQQDWFDSFITHRESRANRRYDLILVQTGLSYASRKHLS